MVKNRWIARGMLLCACAMLLNGTTAFAEEKRLGDFIYVPAMQVETLGGAISLRVEGLALDEQSDEPVTTPFVAGAEFGVYVFSGDGELTPWANPLYPSEQMRIRTTDGETRFTLPQGAEYYLMQESAPQGYLFDEEALIPVTGNEIVVRNAMAGQLAVTAADSLGAPLAGVEITVRDETGSVYTLFTDENGEAVLQCDQAQRYEIVESALPEGVFAARSVSGGESVMDGQTWTGAVAAHVQRAARTRIAFEHPAAGSVLLDMCLSVIDEAGQTIQQPLEGVRMEILGDAPLTIVTDAQGQARASLLEGTYGVRLSYDGEGVLLPLEEGQMIVQSGSTTLIELSAHQTMGRIMLHAQCEADLSGETVTLKDEQTGKEYGPYEMDAEGIAVSEMLPEGVYTICEWTLPEGVQFGQLSCGEEIAQEMGALRLAVEPGELTAAAAQMLTRERQTFALVSTGLDEQGEKTYAALDQALTLELVDEYGEAAAQLESAQGFATIEALSGTYVLRMSDKDAQKLGVSPVSGAFELPSSQESIAFACDSARVMIASVDENGEPVPGAVYRATDSDGLSVEVACDGDGMAVTPLLAPGYVTIETVSAPQDCDDAQSITLDIQAGEAQRAQILHESFGGVQLQVFRQSLNEQGSEVRSAASGVRVHLYQVSLDGERMSDTGIVLVSDEQGFAKVQLEAGDYAARIGRAHV